MTADPKLPGEPLTMTVAAEAAIRGWANERMDGLHQTDWAMDLRAALAELDATRERLRHAESINAELNRIAAASRDNASSLSIELEQAGERLRTVTADRDAISQRGLRAENERGNWERMYDAARAERERLREALLRLLDAKCSTHPEFASECDGESHSPFCPVAYAQVCGRAALADSGSSLAAQADADNGRPLSQPGPSEIRCSLLSSGLTHDGKGSVARIGDTPAAGATPDAEIIAAAREWAQHGPEVDRLRAYLAHPEGRSANKASVRLLRALDALSPTEPPR